MSATFWIPDFAGMTGGGAGRGDSLVGIRAWFRAAILAERLWIPAFAGMTGAARGEGICWLGFKADFRWLF